MTLAELKKTLDATGYPVAYSHFNSTQSLPFITYLVSYTSNFMADNKVHKKINNIQVELYTKLKDLKAEEKLETVLDNAELPYQATETWLSSENMYQRVYDIKL